MSYSKPAAVLTALGLFFQSSYSQLTPAQPAQPSQPPRETAFVEVAPDKVPTDGISEVGHIALSILPAKWKAAETPNFHVHFRRATEAKKVVREIEYDLTFIAQQLGAKPESYARKSHVYVFKDVGEWAQFLAKANAPDWFGSFAHGDELFLSVRDRDDHAFDSQTLAHETTHAVISRIYGARRWPIWLNEGIAEYMGSAAVADRKNQTLKSIQRDLRTADMPLAELLALQKYPDALPDIARLYQTGEKFVRFLMSKGSPAQFVAFANALVDAQPFDAAIATHYPGQWPDPRKFEEDFTKYTGGKR